MPNPGDLAALRNLTEAGKITPIIDETLSLSEISDAVAKVGDGHSQGKTIITVRDTPS